MDFEIAFLEGFLKRKPDFHEALNVLGDLYARRGFYQKSLDIDKRLVNAKPDDPVVYYNLACSYSLLNDIENAIKSLRHAVLLGYNNFRFLQIDEDLENLRADKRFKEFVAKIVHKKTEKP